MIVAIVFVVIVAVMLGMWSASTALDGRAAARRSLQAIETYELVNVREQEMLESVADRVIAPVGRRLLGFARSVTPVGYVEGLKRNIVLAGSPPGYEVDRFLVWKVLGAASGLSWLFLGFTLLSAYPLLMILAIVTIWGLCFFGPDVVLQQRIKERRNEIARRLHLSRFTT